jgi:NTP pyrophosphatase (non-canonical NTP hydrolase)
MEMEMGNESQRDIFDELREDEDNKFMKSFKQVSLRVHATAVEKGWHKEPRSVGDLICLMHSELSEALESYRKGIETDDHIPDFSGIEAEFADVIIRIMDASELMRLDVAGAILAKAKHNESRSYRHGGKKI